ncbi:hypothetical protein [uncultured Brachyspira sp.]|nr:hypothetical protein [uncultured Brachyspira sp.]
MDKDYYKILNADIFSNNERIKKIKKSYKELAQTEIQQIKRLIAYLQI